MHRGGCYAFSAQLSWHIHTSIANVPVVWHSNRRKFRHISCIHPSLFITFKSLNQSQAQSVKSGSAATSGATGAASNADEPVISDDKSHVYWAKGTGFGTGSTQQSWDVEQALLRQKMEEEHVTVLLQVIIGIYLGRF